MAQMTIDEMIAELQRYRALHGRGDAKVLLGWEGTVHAIEADGIEFSNDTDGPWIGPILWIDAGRGQNLAFDIDPHRKKPIRSASQTASPTESGS